MPTNHQVKDDAMKTHVLILFWGEKVRVINTSEYQSAFSKKSWDF